MTDRFIIETDLCGKERVVDSVRGINIFDAEYKAEMTEAEYFKCPRSRGAKYHVSSFVPDGCEVC